MSIKFCPKVDGPCIKEDCAAYTNNMIIEIGNGGVFIKNVTGSNMDYNNPMSFALVIGGCSLYDKIIDEDSLNLMEKFQKEIQ